jgi:hypothetical protein
MSTHNQTSNNRRLAPAIAAAVMSIALVACSAPTNTVIPTDMAQWDTQLAPKLQKLSEEDRGLAVGYLMRAKVGEAFGGNGVPVGFTIGDAIKQQRSWAADQKKQEADAQALKQKLEAERTAAVAAMNKAVIVTLVEKSEQPSDYRVRRYSDTQRLKIGVKNTSEKELVGVSGELQFIDVFDKQVGPVQFSISQHIASGGEYLWHGERDYNQFIPEHRAIWNLQNGQYKSRFVPESLVYADGTKLTAPE